jgi:AbrB family looped-hinge helix DNA binding protein
MEDAMAKVSPEYKVTLPKEIADRFGIQPGDEVEWMASGDSIRILPPARQTPLDRETRLRLFDEATRRQELRETRRGPLPSAGERGWTREDLYTRGRSD